MPLEKEAFAIFCALMKWEFLLRDIHFLLRTDHRNLTFIENDARQKVKRWKLAIQSFNFDLIWLKGKDNIAADHCSRRMHDENGDSKLPPSPVVAQLLCAMAPVNTSSTVVPYFRGSIIRNGKDEEINAFHIIGEYHNSRVGHFGIDKTLRRLVEHNYDWPNMATNVGRFVRHCPCCQKMNVLKPAIIANPYTLASYMPMDRLNIDTIGPMPADNDGFTYVIVVIDTFTRWVELYRAKDTSANSAANALLQHIGRYGTPMEILTDQGSQYKNEMLAHLNHMLGVQHTFATAYSHEENGIVERVNREINRHLRAIFFELKSSDDWSNTLPLVQRILNSQVHSALGVTPAQLMFGNSIDLTRRMFTNELSTPQTIDRSSDAKRYVDRLINRQSELLRIAERTQHNKDVYAIQKQTPGVLTEFPLNSYVLLRNRSDFKQGGRHRFHTPWMGPFKVVNRLRSNGSTKTPDIYVIQDLVTNNMKNVSVHHLREFLWDTEHVDPTQAATSDKQVWMVEDIIDHKPKITLTKFIKLPKKDMSFLVRWQGYDSPEWNSWENMRDTIALHNYLDKIGASSLIPIRYREQRTLQNVADSVRQV